MPNRNYQRGRAFEYRVKRYLEAEGYFVVRAAGSKGCADLVAIRKGYAPELVQCKLGRFTHRELRKLVKAATACGALPVVARMAGNNHMWIEVI
jgi:Holliday junction resolvase